MGAALPIDVVVVTEVLPARLDWLLALAESDEVFCTRFGIPVEPGWSGFPEAVPAAVAAARDCPEDPWGTHLVFDGDGTLVGIGGFKDAPRDGVVEIGYAVSPARQGRGIATAAVEYFLTHGARRAPTPSSLTCWPAPAHRRPCCRGRESC
jgi:RimJ/RimL family protein N-acetyltransferase